MNKEALEAIQLFAMANQLLDLDLQQVERDFAVDLKRGYGSLEIDDSYYPQIDSAIRAEAAKMAPHYEVFYSLEKSIRALVTDTLEAAILGDWWSAVPPNVQQKAEGRHKNEVDSGMTIRSDDLIDFTTFGELSEIIRSNWAIFGSLFTSEKAVARVLSTLNSLRGPIAHSSPLAEDEIVRLHVTVRSWFRLME